MYRLLFCCLATGRAVQYSLPEKSPLQDISPDLWDEGERYQTAVRKDTRAATKHAFTHQVGMSKTVALVVADDRRQTGEIVLKSPAACRCTGLYHFARVTAG